MTRGEEKTGEQGKVEREKRSNKSAGWFGEPARAFGKSARRFGDSAKTFGESAKLSG